MVLNGMFHMVLDDLNNVSDVFMGFDNSFLWDA